MKMNLSSISCFLLLAAISSIAHSGTVSRYEGMVCPELTVTQGADTIAGFKIEKQRQTNGSAFLYLSGRVSEYILSSDVMKTVGSEILIHGTRNGLPTSWAFRVLSNRAGSKDVPMTVNEMSDFLHFRSGEQNMETLSLDLPIKGRLVEMYGTSKMSVVLKVELTNSTTNEVTHLTLGCQ